MIGLVLFLTVLSNDPVIRRADSLFEAEAYAAAESLYTRALISAGRNDTAWVFKGLGNIALAHGRFTSAMQYYEDALAIFESTEEIRGSIRILNNLGQVNALCDSPEKALVFYEQGLSRSELITDPAYEDTMDLVALQGNTGQALQMLQRIEDAEAMYLDALNLARQVHYDRGVADNQHNRAALFQYLGEVDSALILYRTACSLYQELSQTKSEADCLREIGNIYRHLGEYTYAIDHLMRAEQVFQRYHDESGTVLVGQGELENDLGLLSVELGEFTRALIRFQHARDIFQSMGDMRGVAIALQNQAAVYLEYATRDSAYYDSARSLYSMAAKFSKDPYDRAQLLNNQGLFYSQQHAFEEADKAFGNALQLLKEEDELNRIKFLNNRGNNAYTQGKYSLALDYYTQAYSDALLRSHRTWEAALLSNIGMTEHVLGQRDDAEKALVRAAHVIEEIRGLIVSQEFRSTYFEDKIVIYEELISLMHDKGDVKQAFGYAEKAKARAFLDLISGVDFSDRHDISPELRDLVQQEQAFTRKIEYLTGRPEQAFAISELKEVMEELREIYPEYYELKSIDPVDISVLQEALDESTAVIEYFIGPRCGYVFVVTDHSLSMHALTASPGDIYAAVDSMVRLIRRRQDHRVYGARLYELLLGPVCQDIQRAERLCFVPHGVLHHLPFSALPVDSAHVLLDDYDIFYAPSASVYAIVHERSQPRTGCVILFAKSDFSDHEEWFDLPLPGTGAEKDSILSGSGFTGVRVYADLEGPAFEPTEAHFKSVAPDFDIIHCATHGKLDGEHPMDSKIVLSKTDEEDGNLTVREIFCLDLAASLVTLSACETGQLKGFSERGRFSSGDDMTGLTRAFLYAGASSVVASLWKVHDLSTALMMTRFYRNLATMDKVQALCEAQRWLLHSEELYYFNKPFFWAPFVVFGDWQ